MIHLDNIKKLFSKDFVESPLLESFDAGKITLSTGLLVACDPLITSDMLPFTTKFPSGNFPVILHIELESNCVAYVEVVFAQEKIMSWEMAVTDNQNIKDLAEGEVFGYPVESGMGCLMDLETQKALNELEHKLYHTKGVDFLGIYEEFFHVHFFDEKGAIDQFAFLKPSDKKPGTIFAFEAGYGEGFYASYIGFSATGAPVKLVTECIEILVT